MSINSTVEFAASEVSQKTAMDRMYRIQRHFYDVTRAYYLLGRDHLINELNPPAGGTVLEIGCGTCRNIVKAAQKYPNATFHGIDISDEMLKTATTALGRHGLVQQVKLAQADAATFNSQQVFGQTSYDRIYFSYTLSMIPDWQDAVRNALAHLSPSGEFHIVDFGQCENLPRICRPVLQAWLDRFHVTPRRTLHEVVSAEAKVTSKITSLTTLHKGYSWHVLARPNPVNENMIVT